MDAVFAPSSFVGRQSERTYLRELLVNPDVHLVTLSGPGGIGKTHLARMLMAELSSEFVDGTEFIALGGVRDPELVLATIARAIGMLDNGGSPLERLCSRLAGRDLLLVLDDLGRLAAASPDLPRLVDACPWLTILATSRTPLRVDGELVFPLAPLRPPAPDQLLSLEDLRSNEAVELFVRRAQAAKPEFALTAANAANIREICVRVAGIPLASELVAARLRSLAPAELAELLPLPSPVHEQDDRQRFRQTLRGVIAWSDGQLSPASRTIFYALSTVANGSGIATIEAVCGQPFEHQSSSQSALGAFTDLIGHDLVNSVVVGGETRFMMAEAIREYAAERLEATGKSDVVRRRHAHYFLALAEDLAAKLLGPDQETHLARLDGEFQNLRMALQWSLAHAPTIALRLAAALWRFLYLRERFSEGQRWLKDALATPEAENSIARVRTLNGLGVMAWATGNLERALDLQGTSVSLAREIGDAWGMAAAESDRAMIEFMIGGDADRARKTILDVLKQFRALGDRYSEGVALAALGGIAQSQGKLVRASRYFKEALDVARLSGDERGQVHCLFNLGHISRLRGDLERCAAYQHEGLTLAFRMGYQEEMLCGLAGIAGIVVGRGQFKRAARLLGAVSAFEDWMGVSLQLMDQGQIERDIAATKAAVSEELFSRAWESGRGIAFEDAVVEALELTPGHGHARDGFISAEKRGPGNHLKSLRANPDVVKRQLSREHELGELPTNTHGLSKRELEVLPLLAAGRSDREIAEQLFISCQTASTHVKRIRAKLAVNSRVAAAAYAIRHGIA